MPPDHWIHDKAVGGGRIIGEVCHFVDLVMYLAGSKIERIVASALYDPHQLQDTLVVSLSFENGSTASISYFSNGNKSLAKERLEIYSNGCTAIIDDFKKLTIYADKTSVHKLRRQDKGHVEEVARYLKAVREGTPTPIPFEEIELSMRATFKILESIQTRQMVTV